MKFVPLLIFLLLTLNRCEEKQPAPSDVSSVHILSVAMPDTVRTGEAIRFTITCGTPNPCWEFRHFTIARDDKQCTITVLADYDGRPCIQMIGSFTADSSLVLREPGIYRFRFAGQQERVIDRIVVVR